jgi:hypothetical protein
MRCRSSWHQFIAHRRSYLTDNGDYLVERRRAEAHHRAPCGGARHDKLALPISPCSTHSRAYR